MERLIDPVRIGVIGFGRFGRLHSLTLAGLVEAELVGVVARRQESLHAMSQELPDVPGWLNLDQAIAEAPAEAWVVASSTSSHIAITQALLRAGKIVLLEKPVAGTLAEAEQLASLVRPDSSNLMMGHVVLFNSEVRQLIEETDRRGSISYVACERHRPASVLLQLLDENPLETTMVHDLYVVQVLVNGAEPKYFSAQFHRLPCGRVDIVLAQLQWSSGIVASFAASFVTPTGMAPRGFDRIEIFGDGWAGRVIPNPRPIEIWDDRANWPLPQEIRVDRYRPAGMIAEELRCFCRVVRGLDRVPRGATYADAMQVQRWMHRLNAIATG